MGRTAHKSQSVDERMKQIYLRDLHSLGITSGPSNEPLHSMNNADLCRLIAREKMKRD
ncbi:hypothetical protein [Planococcus halotolerans]|uniref:hypothetical protein n=1 Tax=Planococcus halotolerans TaxID=2233542 RepID=UPI0026A37587